MSAYAGLEARWADFSTTGPSWRSLLLAHFRFARPSTRLWLDVLVPVAFMTTITAGDPDIRSVVFFCLTMACGHAAGNMLNDVEDRETDRRSSEPLRSKRPVAIGLISPRTAKIEAGVYTAIAAVSALLVSWYFLLIMFVMGLIVAFHEMGEKRVQTKPLVSNLYATGGMVVLWLGAASVAGDVQWDVAAAYILLMAVYLGPAHSLVKDIRDADNDEAGGKITTSVKYGASVAARYASWSYVAVVPAWALLVFTCDFLPAWAIAAGSAVLVLWIAYTFVAARRLEAGFDKRTAINLHQGSMWTFSLMSIALLAGSLV